MNVANNQRAGALLAHFRLSYGQNFGSLFTVQVIVALLVVVNAKST